MMTKRRMSCKIISRREYAETSSRSTRDTGGEYFAGARQNEE